MTRVEGSSPLKPDIAGGAQHIHNPGCGALVEPPGGEDVGGLVMPVEVKSVWKDLSWGLIT